MSMCLRVKVTVPALLSLLLWSLLSACAGGENAVSLLVHPREKELTLGLPYRAVKHLSVEIRPADAQVQLSWSSSNDEVASVDDRGFVTALSPGTTRITVNTESGGSSVCTLRVRTLPQAFSIRTHQADLRVGYKLNLSPKLTPAPYIPNIYKAITWSSSDTEVAIVDARGRVTAIGPGSAEITGQTVNNITQICVVTVKPS